ncbi:MAG: M16 family metallopeptidase [Candidatus Zixiibacteriota bacterium]
MVKKGIFLMLGLLLWVPPAAVFAQDDLQFKVEEFKLDNGLTFLVVERHTAPVFSGYISVGVGSAYERIGNIGSAHLFEHMMFKGSQEVGTTDYAAEKKIMDKEDSVWTLIDKAQQQTRYIRLNHPEQLPGHLERIEMLKAALDSLTRLSSQYVIQNEFDQIYTRHGSAEFNASTGYDFTNYYVSLPSNRLELWFAMEAGRLKNPALREFFPERDVVSEERRQSVENSGDAKLFEQLCGTALIAHPYQIFWEWQSEENNLTRSDLEEFFKTYYVPQRIVVAVVGDVTVAEVKQMAEKYFGDMPVAKDADPIYTVEPPQTGERRVEVVFDANPAVSIAFHKTSFDDPDEPAFLVIERLLGDGRTSRLYKSLVLDKKLCLSVSVSSFPWSNYGSVYNGIMCIDAYPKEGVSTGEVENAVYVELEKLATEPVTDKELTKIKNQIESEYVWNAYRNMGLAGNLATAQNIAKDWRFVSKYRGNLLAVTPEDIMLTAKTYLTRDNRTVATLIPKQKGEDQ